MQSAVVETDIDIEPELKARIQQAAQRNGRSLHSEVNQRLQGSLVWEDGPPEVAIRILQLQLTEQSARIAQQQAQAALDQALTQHGATANAVAVHRQVLAEAKFGVMVTRAQVQQARKDLLGEPLDESLTCALESA